MRVIPNEFTEVELTAVEQHNAKSVSGYFWMYLQNKIAAYAKAVLEYTYNPEDDIHSAVLEHEKLKAQVVVLQELMGELNDPSKAEAEAENSDNPM